MEFTCSQSELFSAISLCNKAISPKPQHPILTNLLLTVGNAEDITITGFDLSIGITTTFNASIKSVGSIAIPAKTLLEMVGKLEGELHITVIEGVLTIKSKKGKYQIRCVESSDYPELPEVKTESISIPVDALVKGLKGSLFCASVDESKQILTGVHLKSGLDILEFAATDGHRLAVTKAHIDKSVSLEVTIPSKSLSELSKIIAGYDSDSEVAVSLDNGICLFEIDNTKIVTRTLEGMYPAYNTLIPKQFSNSVTLDRKEFLAAIERVSVLTNVDGVIGIELVASDNHIILTSENKDIGNSTETMNTSVSGGDLTVYFNSKYLIDGIKSLSSPEIQMHLNNPLHPVVFTPISGNSSLYLAMPIQNHVG